MDLPTAIRLSNSKLFCQQADIDGAVVDADDGSVTLIDTPSSGALIGTVPLMGVAETERAIAAAGVALPAWRDRTAKERSRILRRWVDLIVANGEDLAHLMTMEQGKPPSSRLIRASG